MLKTKIKYMIILFIILFISFFDSQASALPKVTGLKGNINHGAKVEISGSGFGLKSNPFPIRYDDFEGLTNGQGVGTATGWWEGEKMVVNKSYQRNTVSTRNAKIVLPGVIKKNNIGFANTKKAYVNLWVRFDWGEGDDSYQIKTWRIANRIVSGGTDMPTIALFHWFYTSGKARIQWITKKDDGEGGGKLVKNLYTDLPYPPTNPIWLNLAMQVDQNDLMEGSLTVWSTNFKGGAILRQSSTHQVRNEKKYLNAIKIGEYIGSGGDSSTLYYDNIYIDNSWARVELGDKGNYNECTIREIQIPSAWSENSITITVNQGSFAYGKTVYLYAIDPNGNSNSQGYPITIGGSGNNTAQPSPPVGLKIIEP
jgi:hypothetical protein